MYWKLFTIFKNEEEKVIQNLPVVFKKKVSNDRVPMNKNEPITKILNNIFILMSELQKLMILLIF